jgi:ParB family transcriptional regulator, chromosome partitioning protein
MVLAFAGQNVRVDSGADGTFYGGKRFSRHAITLFDEHGKLAFDQDTLRIAVRSVLIDVLSCRRGISNSGMVSRIAGEAIGADEYLPNMGSEYFLLCLSRQALEASCAEASIQPRPKVRETRAALVEHFQSERFVHMSARFAPPAEELLDWIRASAPTDTIGAAPNDDDGGQADDPAEDQDGQIDEAADQDDLQDPDLSDDGEHDDTFDQRAAA